MPRRTRIKKKRTDAFQGIALGAIGLVLIVILFLLSQCLGSLHVAVDPDSLCPKSGPTAIHVILIDKSDPITAQQAQQVQQHITEIKSEAEIGTKFDFYTFSGDLVRVLNPEFSMCMPKRPGDANELVENPKHVQKRFEKFSRYLAKSTGELLTTSTRKTSPIIESLKASVQTSFGEGSLDNIPLRVTIVSDMVQHSGLVSHYRSAPDFSALANDNDWIALRPNLKGAEVEILYVLRASAVRAGERIQNRGHQLFWEKLISASSGTLNLMKPI